MLHFYTFVPPFLLLIKWI